MDFFGSSSSSKSHKKPKNGSANSKSGGGGSSVVLSTLKRKLPTSSTSSASPSLSPSGSEARRQPGTTNALPPEVRARIEAAREAQRRKQIEAEAEAQVRTKNVAKQRKQSSSAILSKKKRRTVDMLDSDEDSASASASRTSRSAARDEEDDDLFGSADEDGLPAKKSSGHLSASRSASRRASPNGSAASNSVYTYLGRSGVQQPYLVPRQAHLVSNQGQNDKAKDSVRPVISSSQLVAQAMAKKPRNWGPFFKDLSFDPSERGTPRCTLEYPQEGAAEEFTLVVSRDSDEYDPISDLLRSVYVIVKYYLTKDQREQFGELEELETGSAAGHVWTGQLLTPGEASLPTGSETPMPLTPTGESAPETPGPVSQAIGTLKSPGSGANTPQHISAISASLNAAGQSSGASILRSFTKARNRRSGTLFLETVSRFNTEISALRAAGTLRANVRALIAEKGVPDDVWMRIQDQAYARTVAPRVDELSGYRSFSDNVYGELTPRFMSEISQLCGLRPEHTMLDLGCGVGNLVVQSALQIGCTSLGVEFMPVPAALGSEQLTEAKARWSTMWDLTPFIPQESKNVSVWQGDFLEDERVRQRMKDADLVIVNNYAFTPPLNQSLSLLFLDLKDGAKIVSLKPFVPHDFRLTERTLGSSSAILRVEEREYGKGMVSWTERGGKYFIATVDRTALQNFLERGHEVTSTPRKRKVAQSGGTKHPSPATATATAATNGDKSNITTSPSERQKDGA